MKSFLIGGCIADEKEMPDDVTPKQVQGFLDSLDDGEEALFEINSYGGSCTAGLAVANLIKACGHKTVAHVVGIAASISSVIACSCDELEIDSNAFLMIHNPWSCVQGNASDLRKEADTLDKFKMALVSIYRSKFDLPTEEIERMMDDETWILGEQAETYCLRCEVIPTKEPLKVAACIDPSKRLNGIPNKLQILIKSIEGLRMKKTLSKIKSEGEPDPDKKEVPESGDDDQERKEEQSEEQEEEKDPEERIAELEKEVEELKAKLAEYEEGDDDDGDEEKEEETEAKMNDIRKGYEANLVKVRDEVARLADSLAKSQKELGTALSALKDRQKALDTLNCHVLSPATELPTMNEGLAKCKTPSERVAFLKSGKYKL